EYPKVVGGIDAESARVAMEMYKTIVKGGVYTTDITSAEVAKTVENAYRDVQIAFANEVALLCESFGVDVYDIRKYVNGLPDDPSTPHANPIRNMHFPGAGVGGHCLPKDTWLLINSYREYAEKTNPYPTSVLADARHLNDWMPVHMADLIESGLKEAGGELKGSRIGVLGYAFLENSDDARNSPSATLLKELEKRGATFRIHDPFVTKDSGYEISQDLDDTLKGCDAVAIMTKHDEYTSLEPGKLKQLLSRNVIVDGRNVLDPVIFMDDGFVYRGVGKGKAMKKLERKV
ncbi:MAG: nucleotide sugar dehydrogenase, partial [Dehalococcoidales bacterium]|nr:nucleotide sugar dehydrogenase [Dehalococcoidales bacterium]